MAGSLGVAALALAGTVVYTSNNDWDVSFFTLDNLIHSGGGNAAVLEMVTVDDLDVTGDWYRQPWDGVNFAFEVEKDGTVLFSGADPCVLDANNTLSNTDTLTVAGTRYRAGQAAASPEEATLPSGTTLLIPGGGQIDELRFLTSSARLFERSYTITFTYAGGASLDVVPMIPRDTDVSRTRIGIDYFTDDWTGPIATIGGACAASAGNEVLVTNPDPATDVTAITFTFDESPNAAGWLAGPYAVTLFSDEPTLEAMFAYRGTYESTHVRDSTALDAGVANAAWTVVSWNETVTDGSEIELYVRCGTDVDNDTILESNEFTAEQGPIFLAGGLSSPLTACFGRYAIYRLEYYSEFDPGSAPYLSDITFTFDTDADGDGDPDSADCNDADAAIFHGAVELPGDGVNQDCTLGELCFTDFDNDSARLITTVVSADDDCTDNNEGVTGDPIDCVDNNAGISPLATDSPDNGADENCNGTDACYTDVDNDDARLTTTVPGNDLDCLDENEGQFGDDIDCSDGNPGMFPDAIEITNDGIDQNCNSGDQCWADVDDDGSRHPTNVVNSLDLDCTDANEGVTGDPIDCDDGNGNIEPGDPETASNNIDENCDGFDDCFTDADNDGERLATQFVGNDMDCLDANEGQTADLIDCLDSNAAFNHPANDLPDNAIDENCDLKDDCYTDFDNDGSRLTTEFASNDMDCIDANEGRTADPIDCNDTNAAISFGGLEIVADGTDQDCSGGDTCYADADGDLARHPTNTVVSTDLDCADLGEGETADPQDCNDGNPAIFPAADDLPDNALDENCDSKDNCWADFDNDGSRHPTNEVVANDMNCTDANEGQTGDPIDCDDNFNTIEPGAPEVVADGIDQDCNDGDVCHDDLDNDGNRSNTGGTRLSADLDCADDNEGATTDPIDCADLDPLRFIGNTELVNNSRDDDCDLLEMCWENLDSDVDRGVVKVEASVDTDCTDLLEGETTDAIDCNDTISSINSAAGELPGDELDQNCDTDEMCYVDSDQDGDRHLTTTVFSADLLCTAAGEGQTADVVDCDDNDPLRFSANLDTLVENIGNNIDNDCNLFERCFTDGDDDGTLLSPHTSFQTTDMDCFEANEGEASDPDDCDDTRADSAPGLLETPGNEVDNDCSSVPSLEICWLDADNDGARNPGVATINSADVDCDDANEGETVDVLDCNEGDAAISPLDPEVRVLDCGNGIDDDCDNDGDFATPGPGGYLDDDADGLEWSFEVSIGTDDCDADSDDDGLTDDEEVAVENCADPRFADTDNDGFGDLVEVGSDPLFPLDSDGDGECDANETDDDNDGIPTIVEESVAAGPDVDNDGVPNYLDLDSDGDGHSDATEWTETPDADGDDDGDGDPDFVDLDSDDDQVLDEFELATDFDNDGLPNRIDADDDGDRVDTLVEGTADPDGDGRPNYLDTDDDNDTVLTTDEDPNGVNGPADDDSDGDLAPNYLDTDDDDDNIATVTEAAQPDDRDLDGIDNWLDLDSDGDGFADNFEYFAVGSHDFDNDGLADSVDTDSDGDNVPDAFEQHADTDGDGDDDRIDEDDDGDGVYTADEESESINQNPRDDDFDGDTLPDFRDDDDDDDTVLTATENYNGGTPENDDTDGDGDADYLDVDDDADEVLTFSEVDGGFPVDLDTDGDGTDNYIDDDDDDDTLLTRDEEPVSNNGNPRDDDSDGDGQEDYLDADDDDDQVDTACEVNASPPADHLDTDSDNDTVIDGVEWYNFLSPDTDSADYEDLQNANAAACDPQFGGGLLTGFTCDTPWDRDSDGAINALDSDDDGDGLATALEGNDDLDCGVLLIAGSDVDGIPNWLDYDADNDGDPDCSNGGPDPLGDGDGVNDADGDSLPDFVDCDPSGCSGDSDADGLTNCIDSGPGDPDQDDDGILDGHEAADTDGDTPVDDDSLDGFNGPDLVDADDDGDGIPTLDEAGFGICPFNLVYNPATETWDRVCDDDLNDPYNPLNGVTLAYGPYDASNPENPLGLPNTDADLGEAWPFEPDGIPDYLDADDDGDGTPTSDEGDLTTDTDGDGVVDYLDPVDFDGPLADADGDGLTNQEEVDLGTNPYDADSDQDGMPDSGESGDTDGDDIPDALDPDDDGDGIPSAVEGDLDLDGDGSPNRVDDDSDGDGVSDADEGATADSDCDGILDWGDPDDADGVCGTGGDTVEINTGTGCEGGCNSGGTAGSLVIPFAVLGLIRRRRR